MATERLRDLIDAPIAVPKAAALVANGLRRRIVLGEVAEGSALPNETELMASFGVSRPVVREALRILEAEALISVKRGTGGGARVRTPTVSVTARHAALLLRTQGTTLEDVFLARSIVEPAAVGLLAASASAETIATLVELHEASLALVDDPVGFPLAAARFHTQIVELAGNRTLTLLAQMVNEIVQAHNSATFAVLAHPRDVAEHAESVHARVLEHITARDGEAAVTCWREHLRSAAEVAMAALDPDTIVDLLDPPM